MKLHTLCEKYYVSWLNVRVNNVLPDLAVPAKHDLKRSTEVELEHVETTLPIEMVLAYLLLVGSLMCKFLEASLANMNLITQPLSQRTTTVWREASK